MLGFQDNGGRWTRGIYMKLGEQRREKENVFFWGVGEAKFQFNLLGSVAFVWIWIILS
jgi:hypothetical protein